MADAQNSCCNCEGRLQQACVVCFWAKTKDPCPTIGTLCCGRRTHEHCHVARVTKENSKICMYCTWKRMIDKGYDAFMTQMQMRM